jgi:FkbM family methyltransferase
MTAIIASTFFGPMLLPQADQDVGRSLVTYGRFSPFEFETWRPYLPEGGVVVDAGANVGGHTLAFASIVGMTGGVHAFEPQRELFFMLCGSLALCGGSNVFPHNRALGRERSIVRIPAINYSVPQNFGCFSLRDPIPEGVASEPIGCIPLDEMKLQRLDFLKIDVEGFELDVLHGSKETIARCKPVLCVEADREQNTPAVLAWLRLNGYRAWWHKPPLGDLWPGVVSINLMCLPRERSDLPEPEGFIVGAAIE